VSKSEAEIQNFQGSWWVSFHSTHPTLASSEMDGIQEVARFTDFFTARKHQLTLLLILAKPNMRN
jgi:hypothetical protein